MIEPKKIKVGYNGGRHHIGIPNEFVPELGIKKGDKLNAEIQEQDGKKIIVLSKAVK